MRDGERLALAAAKLLGAPFRLQGRNPRFGIDCVGLVTVAIQSIGRPVVAPSGYRLRNATIEHWLRYAEQCSLVPAEGGIETGDVILVTPGAGQAHLLIAENSASFLHAHAGLRKVVRQTGAMNSPIRFHWRLAARN